MTATTQPPVYTCNCGCGRPLRTARGTWGTGYADPCARRWDRQGRPEGGPLPGRTAKRLIIGARLDRLEALFAQGYTYAQAAAELKVTVRSLENYAKELNQRKREQGAEEGADLRPARPLPAAAHWGDRAACRGHEDLFFGPDGERLAERQAREIKAKLLCGVCPVIAECLDYSRRIGAKDGVWAGISESDREQEKRDRKNASRRVAARRDEVAA